MERYYLHDQSVENRWRGDYVIVDSRYGVKHPIAHVPDPEIGRHIVRLLNDHAIKVTEEPQYPFDPDGLDV